VAAVTAEGVTAEGVTVQQPGGTQEDYCHHHPHHHSPPLQEERQGSQWSGETGEWAVSIEAS